MAENEILDMYIDQIIPGIFPFIFNSFKLSQIQQKY